jgi:hypothetical protein
MLSTYDLRQRANYHHHQVGKNYICNHKEQAKKHYMYVLLEP